MTRRDCGGRENRPFEHKGRTVLKQNAILETSRFVLSTIANHIAGVAVGLCSDCPFLAYRKASATSSAESGGSDFFKDVSVDRLIASGGAVLLECLVVCWSSL